MKTELKENGHFHVYMSWEEFKKYWALYKEDIEKEIEEEKENEKLSKGS